MAQVNKGGVKDKEAWFSAGGADKETVAIQ